MDKTPKMSEYRKNQINRTKENFSTEHREYLTPREFSPNPLTGQGYSEKKKGIKTSFERVRTEPRSELRAQSHKKHFNFYFY